MYKNWRLNERHYGDLVGRNKKEAVEEHGVDKVKRWRRSWDYPPPPMDAGHPHWPGKDKRYVNMIDLIPKSESLKDTRARSEVFWDEVAAPALRDGKTILIVGHENNLRRCVVRSERGGANKG